MKKNLVAFAVAAAVLVPGAAFAADSSAKDNGPILYGYAQITGSQQFGTGPSASNGLVFGANRIRLGVKGEAVHGVTYNIMAGWDNAAISGNNGGLGNLLNNGLGNGGNASIVDAWLNYAPVPFAQLEVGKFKQPVGNEYVDVQGNALPFIFRSMGQSLLPGRSAGAMLHGNDVMGTGFGYALAISDASSFDYGSAYNNLEAGSHPSGGGQGYFLNGSGQYIFSGRLTYDFMGPLLHAELSGAQMTLPLSNMYNADSLTTWNVGVHGGLMGIHYVAGYTNLNTGRSRNGQAGVSAQDWNVGLGVNLHQMTLTPSWLDIEPAVRFDSFSYNDHRGTDEKLDNTTVGLNYYVNPNNPHAAQIQVNYIIPTGRSGKFGPYATASTGVFGGYGAPINGMAYNTLMLQFQAGF
ncbi:porin [Acidithiobacillus sp. IBUN Pt1247-S3]|uniref:porin n=1 Tax=Acidithiobacillus sp. IBUN Pt1247-S3 TaxID=3166642 RepID=UPI0034E43E69